jgi:hypothetical protein
MRLGSRGVKDDVAAASWSTMARVILRKALM